MAQLNIDFKFTIYTKQQNLLSDYIDKLGDRLIVKDYIQRLELIKELSTMDFLLNIENGTDVQTPSKLIDYALAKQPIISLNSNKLDKNKFKQFLNYDYSQQRIVSDLEQYNIKKVAQQFIDLA